ncbi:MAG TPA: hypothetical protein VHH35_04000, partial [Pyrinomonadaceae bacterium]|nr:hypothetical protein [Pyrinomonadaceae bacterium]
NFGPLFGLVMLNFFLNFAGLLLCFFGMYLALPIGYAAIAVAYEQVFGLSNLADRAPEMPPPPPVFT